MSAKKKPAPTGHHGPVKTPAAERSAELLPATVHPAVQEPAPAAPTDPADWQVMAPAPEPPTAKPAPIYLTLARGRVLTDPYAHLRFPLGERVKVYEVTSWMQCQLDAGILVFG